MWLLILLLVFPSVVSAEIESCPGCVVGIYDDPELSLNYGFWDPVEGSAMKSIWVGITYDSTVPDEMRGLAAIELSIDGIPPSRLFSWPQYVGVPDPVLTIGRRLDTPDDEVNGEGGINMVWEGCLMGDQPLIRIDMLSLDPVGHDIVITVRRKFPPSSSEYPVPQLSQCDHPNFTRTRVTRGCYVLNPTVRPGAKVGGCTLNSTVAIEQGTWSVIKSLYR